MSPVVERGAAARLNLRIKAAKGDLTMVIMQSFRRVNVSPGRFYPNKGEYFCSSLSDPTRHYRVGVERKSGAFCFTCSCPDWIHRKDSAKKHCKHIDAVVDQRFGSLAWVREGIPVEASL